MRINIALNDLPSTKNKAHTILDTIKLDWPHIEHPSKATFLNAWGAALGYRDWNDVVTTSKGHGNRASEPILTPSTISVISKRLREELTLVDIDTDFMASCVFKSATQEERVLFQNTDRVATNNRPSDQPIRLEVGPRSAAARTLLNYIWPLSRAHVVTLHDSFLSVVKKRRKGLSDEEARSKGLDINLKRSIPLRAVIEELVEYGYLTFSDNKSFLNLTEHATFWLTSYHTDENSPEWKSWFKTFRALMAQEEGKAIREDWGSYIREYANGKSPEDACKMFGWSSVERHAAATLRGVIDKLKLPNHAKLLHIHPSLLLAHFDAHIRASSIRLDITCDNIDLTGQNVKLKKPWPNKRYVAASSGLGMEGLFLKVIGDPNRSVFTFRWTMPKRPDFLIEHRLIVSFGAAGPEAGGFYSTAVAEHYQQYTPADHKPCALYDLCGFAKPEADEPLEAALKRHPRLQGQITRIEKANGKMYIDETLHVEYADIMKALHLL